MNLCHIFEFENADEAYENMDFEIIEDYGDELYGNILYTWDDGERKLLRCRKCGANVLM